MAQTGESETPESAQAYRQSVQAYRELHRDVDRLLHYINPDKRPADLQGKIALVSDWFAHAPHERHDMRSELEATINRHCAENGSDTPDFILAEYLTGCLANFDRALQAREKHYGRGLVFDPAPWPTPEQQGLTRQPELPKPDTQDDN